MKAVLLFVAAVMPALAQEVTLSPTAEFNLHAGLKPHHQGRVARTYFVAGPSGLRLVTIDNGRASLVSADLEGRVLYSKSDLFSVRTTASSALLRPDGSVWLVSTGPCDVFDCIVPGPNFGAVPAGPSIPAQHVLARTGSFYEMNLYSPAGQHLDYARVLAPTYGSDIPVAASNDKVILRSEIRTEALEPPSEMIKFGSVNRNQFRQQAQINLEPPVTGEIDLMSPNGDVVVVAGQTGNMIVIDPTRKSAREVRLSDPHHVFAAASSGGYLYFLSAGTVLKVDLSGQIVATYHCRFNAGFHPGMIGVNGNSLYLVR